MSINDAEKAAFGLNVSRSGYSREWYVVLQVYHDLHCLKVMRDSFWSLDAGRNVNEGVRVNFGKSRSFASFRQHIALCGMVIEPDHCIDTIRQALMCNADLSPIPKEPGAIEATWNIDRQCRNWDAVVKWAKSRNTTGMFIQAHDSFLPKPVHISEIST